MKEVASWRPALFLDEIPKQRKESSDLPVTAKITSQIKASEV